MMNWFLVVKDFFERDRPPARISRNMQAGRLLVFNFKRFQFYVYTLSFKSIRKSTFLQNMSIPLT